MILYILTGKWLKALILDRNRRLVPDFWCFGCRPQWDPPEVKILLVLLLSVSLTGCFLWVPHPPLSAPAPAPQPLPVGDSLPAVSMVTWLLIVCSELWLFFFFPFLPGCRMEMSVCGFFRGVISCFVCLLLGSRKLFEIRLQNCMFCHFSVKVFEEYFHWFQLCQLFRRQDCSLWNTWASLSFSDQIFLVLNFALKSFGFLRFSEPFEQNETPTLQVFFPGLQWCIMDLRTPQTHTQTAPQSDMFVLNIVI